MKELKTILRACQSWEEHKKVLESALFMAPGALKLEELAKLIGVSDEHTVEQMLNELIEEYNRRESSIEIVCIDNAYQMRVKPEHLDKVRHLATKAEMNKAVQRTLALIAVKEPIPQSHVVKYRNNKAYDHIKLLVDEGFVVREPFGRTYLLRTTEKFRQYFGDINKQVNNA